MGGAKCINLSSSEANESRGGVRGRHNGVLGFEETEEREGISSSECSNVAS